MRHKTPALIFMGLSVVLAVTAVVLGFRTWGGRADAAEQPGVQAPAEDQTAPNAVLPPANVSEPTPTGVPTPTPEPTPEPWPGPVVPEQAEPMGSAYFADAGFLGNSVTSGLWLYNNDKLLPTDESHWHWADSLTIMGAAPYAAQMTGMDFGKIYMGFGINEVNYDKSTLEAAFNTVIDQLQADHPNAIIYVMSVTPVSAWCDANRDFKRSAVLSFNEMLQNICKEQQVWYLDVYPALCGDDGYLPSDVTPDGVHFNGAWYQNWYDYMKTHYIPDGTPPESAVTPEPAPETAGDQTQDNGAG